jgi:hypothetical protein
VILLIFITNLLWDMLLYFTMPVDKKKYRPSVCRSVMRKCDRRIKRIRPSHAALYFFPAMWLIFSGSISVYHAAYQGLVPTHPFELAYTSIVSTYECIMHLDMIVDLYPGTFAQHRKLQARNWLSETFPK